MTYSSKYERLKAELAEIGNGKMKCYGNSMLPILSNPCTNSYEKKDSYKVDDIVFSKVKGRYIDAHKITKIGKDGKYMISNNKGHDNGWASEVYGKVVSSEDSQGRIKHFK